MGYLASPRRAALVTSALLALASLATGCGKEIGDSCSFDTDCDTNGNRVCVDPTAGFGGYCTIVGCDETTCPDEAVCIRFFTGGFTNKACLRTDGTTDDTLCSVDELCGIEGLCVPRSSEVRFCMKSCGDNGDCRDGYECRTYDLAREHGGQPVSTFSSQSFPKFCAVAPTT